MKLKNLMIAIIGIIFIATQLNAQKPVEMKNKLDSVAYGIGMNIGMNLKQDDLMLDLDLVLAGLKDGLYGETTLLTQEQVTNLMMALQQELADKQQAELATQAEGNKKIGEDFLAKNKEKEGVNVTASGLQYEIITPGTGKHPTETDMVKVHYTGTFIDGSKFDSSVDRGTPAEFPLNGVIKGWTEGLQLMKEGGKWKFYIPYELAYGENGRPPQIPPASVLIFEVELLEVLPSGN
jgi:FKBP-type peptidyl-prolyl cis-trans isomerase FkpA